MAFCVNCGTKLTEGAKFCPNCGTKAAAGKTVKDWIAEGQALYQQKNFAEAVRCFTEAIALEPQNPLYYSVRGGAYHFIKEYNKNIADQTEAIRLDPNNSIFYGNRGASYSELGENEKALADQTEAIRLDPNNYGYYFNRALLFKKLKDYPKAIADFEKAVELAPDNQAAIKALADAKAEAAAAPAVPKFCPNCGAKTEGAKFCPNCGAALAAQASAPASQPAPASSPAGKTAEEWEAEADAFNEQENYAEAVRCYTEAIKLAPENAGYYDWRGDLYNNLKDYPKALADYSKAIELDPEKAVYYCDRGALFGKTKEYSNALADSSKAIELDPESNDTEYAYWNRALVYDALKKNYEAAQAWGQTDRCLIAAIADYTEFLRVKPDDEDIKPRLMERAETLLKSGGSAEDPVPKKVAIAIDVYTKIIEQDESYPGVWTKRAFAKIMGFQYFDAKFLDEASFENYDQILPDLDRAIEENGEDGEAYAYRAEVHYRCGRNDAAIEDLQRALELDADCRHPAEEMYDDGVELPEEIIDMLRDEGCIESDDDEEEDEGEDEE